MGLKHVQVYKIQLSWVNNDFPRHAGH